jgi:4'-phosphopantetheinyl transferase
VLARYLELEPAAIELRHGEHGKPLLASAKASLRFNLSHSDGLALVAVAEQLEVGVDVERIKPRRDLLGLARRALVPAEAAQVEAAAPQDRLAVFHAAWARREATAKCLGAGLRAPLPAAAVAVAELGDWPGFAAAVAVAATTVPQLRCFALEPG